MCNPFILLYNRNTILVDGGIRTGMDLSKALVLGAEGVQVYVNKLQEELADTVAMCGAHTLDEITRCYQ